jgi:hypothetical protein
MKDLGDMLRESGTNMVLFGALMIVTGLAGVEIAWYFAIGTTIAIAAYVGFLMIFLWSEPAYEERGMWETGKFSVADYAELPIDTDHDMPAPLSSVHLEEPWPAPPPRKEEQE